MSIKRYVPKYKKLAKFKQPLWLEKSGKIRRFNRQKWEFRKKAYLSKKYKFFNQDVSACNVGKSFDDEKFTRLKKTYKFLLMDKQRLQFYYGAGRLRFYQLKKLARKSINIANIKKDTHAKVLLDLLESRIQNNLYRLGYASSLMQSRRLINRQHLRINNVTIENVNLFLKRLDNVTIDPALLSQLTGCILRSSFPLLYFRFKKRCNKLILARNEVFFNSQVQNNILSSFDFSKKKIESLKILINQRNKNASKKN